MWEGSGKQQQWPLPALLSGETCPPPQFLSWCRTIQFLPVCLWCLSTCCLCVGAQTESKSVHGPFKRKYLGLQKFLSSTALIPTGFYSQKLWKLIFQHWNTELGGLVWGWDPFLLRYPSQFLSPHMGVWPAHYTSPPLLPVLYGFLFNFTVVGLPFSLISDGSEWWLFYRLVVIFMYLCREASHVPLYCHLFH